MGRRPLPKETDAARARLTAVEAAIFGLMGLLIAFTFFGAAGRYELRRQLVVEEANAIGTAYLRLDVLPVSAQPALREKFRLYLEARIAVYRLLPDIDASTMQAAVAASLQQEIWAGAIAALREAPSQATIMLIPALNQMIDVMTSRAIAALTHTPPMIFGLLVMLALVWNTIWGERWWTLVQAASQLDWNRNTRSSMTLEFEGGHRLTPKWLVYLRPGVGLWGRDVLGAYEWQVEVGFRRMFASF